MKIYETEVGGGKNLSISIIRFIAMCSIIACHFCQYYDSEWAWWLNIGVQIFFIVSGYLYGTRKIVEPITWLKRQFVKILIPYWLCLTLTLVPYYLYTPELLSIRRVVCAYLTLETIQGIGHLWFIGYILFCYLITPYLSYLRDFLLRYSISKAVVLIGLIFGIYSVSCIIMSAHYRPGAVCCYVFGYFIASMENRTKKDFIRVTLTYLIIPCLFLNSIYCYFRYYKHFDMYHGYIIHLTDYSRLCLGLVVTLSMMTFIKNVKEFSILRFSDKNSYEIYLIHQFFILSPFTILGLTEFPIIDILLTLCIILLFGWLVHQIDRKILNKYFAAVKS